MSLSTNTIDPIVAHVPQAQALFLLFGRGGGREGKGNKEENRWKEIWPGKAERIPKMVSGIIHKRFV